MSQAVYKRTDKRADEHAYKRTGERADEHAYKRTDERAYEHANKRTDARAYKHVYERVKLARDSKRPTGLDYIKNTTVKGRQDLII